MSRTSVTTAPIAVGSSGAPAVISSTEHRDSTRHPPDRVGGSAERIGACTRGPATAHSRPVTRERMAVVCRGSNE